MTRQYSKFLKKSKDMQNYANAAIKDNYTLVFVAEPTTLDHMAGSYEYDPFEQDILSQIKEFRLELAEHIIKNIDKILTDKQAYAFKQTIIENKTQQQVADTRNMHQSTIHKALFGNIVYDNGTQVARHGGASRKIFKWIKKDPTSIQLLQNIKTLEGQL